VNSIIMSEDGQFCSHWGVDWGALNAVLDREGGPSRGASTIAMQTVKNLFLWSSRSYIRKGLEIPLAYYADFILSKRRIMEIYLNIAEWGPGIFGAEAAAQHYFNKPLQADTAPGGAADSRPAQSDHPQPRQAVALPEQSRPQHRGARPRRPRLRRLHLGAASRGPCRTSKARYGPSL
jgi:membrane peptidoglycan carboxypeptidase